MWYIPNRISTLPSILKWLIKVENWKEVWFAYRVSPITMTTSSSTAYKTLKHFGFSYHCSKFYGIHFVNAAHRFASFENLAVLSFSIFSLPYSQSDCYICRYFCYIKIHSYKIIMLFVFGTSSKTGFHLNITSNIENPDSWKVSWILFWASQIYAKNEHSNSNVCKLFWPEELV